MDNYQIDINYLIKQFRDAKGYKDSIEEIEEYYEEFLRIYPREAKSNKALEYFMDYARRRQYHIRGLQEEYTKFCNDRKANGQILQGMYDILDIPYDSQKTVEFGKSLHDTLCYENNTQIATTRCQGMLGVNYPKLHNCQIRFINCEPLYQIADGSYQHLDANFYMTHNPYTYEEVEGLDDISKHGYGYSLAVYGKVNDKDFEEKMNYIQDFAKKYKSEFVRAIGGRDYYSIAYKKQK